MGINVDSHLIKIMWFFFFPFLLHFFSHSTGPISGVSLISVACSLPKTTALATCHTEGPERPSLVRIDRMFGGNFMTVLVSNW